MFCTERLSRSLPLPDGRKGRKKFVPMPVADGTPFPVLLHTYHDHRSIRLTRTAPAHAWGLPLFHLPFPCFNLPILPSFLSPPCSTPLPPPPPETDSRDHHHPTLSLLLPANEYSMGPIHGSIPRPRLVLIPHLTPSLPPSLPFNEHRLGTLPPPAPAPPPFK